VLMRFICIWERDVPVFFFQLALGLFILFERLSFYPLVSVFRRSFMSPFCLHE
jgi:hypothetical protein